MVLAAPAALADPPADGELFNPAGETGLVNVLSDRNDGQDSLAHLTAVGTDETTTAIFVSCPPGGFPTEGAVPPNGCEIIGTDTSPTAPISDTGTTGDEAYEIFYDIPSQRDEELRDIGVYLCTDTPGSEGTDTDADDNCRLDFTTQVILDDSESGTFASSTAELGTICVVEEGDTEAEDCIGTPVDLVHGASLPTLEAGEDYLVTATSSGDVTELTLCVGASDATDPPNTCAAPLTSTDTTGDTREYTFIIPVAVPAEADLTLFDSAGGSGACGAGNACQLDSHYVIVSELAGGQAVASFTGGFPAADCEDPDTAARTNDVGEPEAVFGCLLDASDGEPIAGAPFTFILNDDRPEGSGFTACSGELDDFDGDGDADACTGVTGANGAGGAVVNSPENPGTLTITFCADDENNQEPLDPVERFGCADEPGSLVATLTKIYQAGPPNQVTLVFDDGDGDCEGTTFLENQTGETDELIACVLDADGNPTSTTREDDGGELQWELEEGADDQTDTSFVGTPPQEDDGTGTAVATIQANDPGTDNIVVTLRDEEGDFVDSAEVQKQVERGQGVVKKFESTVTIRGSFKGQVASEKTKCVKKRTVILQKKVNGNWTKVGKDKTNKAGNWKENVENPNGKYRAKVKKKRFTKPNGTTIVCKGDKSPSVTK